VRKFNIVEIENSYLNFFTPAVIIAAGIFLFNLFSWPSALIDWLIEEANISVNQDLVRGLIANIIAILICLIVYFVFIPRLKVKDVTYDNPELKNVSTVFSIFFVVIFFRILLTIIFETLGSNIYLITPWYLDSYHQLLNPGVLLQFILHQFFIIPVYTEILYRRTVIPLLEDRGLSPFFAVILSSSGFCLLYLPEYLYTTNYLGTLYWFGSTFFFGLATGFIYIITRNVIFSILYAAIYYIYRFIHELGTTFQDETLLHFHLFLNIVILILGIITISFVIWDLFMKESRWVKIIKTPSAPQITRGVVGYFSISLILVSIHLILIGFIELLTSFNILVTFILKTIFYLIAFSIPFWLTITSEYAQF